VFAWTLIRWLHLLAMGFFVGGQLMLAAIVVPVMRGSDRAQLRAAPRRFGDLQVKLGLVVLVGLLIGWHTRKPELHALEGLIFLASLAIVWLGVSIAH
jgi:hypothetical protein